MFSIYLVFFVLCGIAVVMLMLPLLQKVEVDTETEDVVAKSNDRQAINIRLYKEKLAQLEKDLSSGMLDEDAFDMAKLELQQSLLQDDDEVRMEHVRKASPISQGTARMLVLILAVAIPVFSFGLYAFTQPMNIEEIQAGISHDEFNMPANGEAPDVNEMVSKLEQRLEENPDNPQGWAMLGRSYGVLGRTDEAITAYKKAIELSDGDSEYAIDLVDLLFQSDVPGNFQQARILLLDVLAKEPENADALWFMGLLEVNEGKLAEASVQWKKLLQILPEQSQEYQLVSETLARLEAAMQQPEAAVQNQNVDEQSAEEAFIQSMITRLENRLKENPEDTEGWKTLGRSYFVQKRFEDSATAYAKALALSPDDDAARLAYAKALLQAGQLTEAEQQFKLILQHEPDNEGALWFAGQLSLQSGNKDGAREHWSKLEKLLPKDSEAYPLVKQALENVTDN